MTTIAIFFETLTGNMGDGWRDEREAAEACTTFQAAALRTYAQERYPDATVDVRTTIQRASGAGRGLEVVSDLPAGEDIRLQDVLGDIANKAWEDFCASDEARTLYGSD